MFDIPLFTENVIFSQHKYDDSHATWIISSIAVDETNQLDLVAEHMVVWGNQHTCKHLFDMASETNSKSGLFIK